jgi:hypothetical protein
MHRKQHTKGLSTYRGEFVDPRQLGFALDDRRYTLASACEAYGIPDGKLQVQKHGEITDQYIDYNRRDTAITEALTSAMLTEFLKHPIDLSAADAYSSATLAKSYLRAMGIIPIFQKCPAFPRSVLGYGMEAFYGGRTECRIRRVLVPVVHLDFTSMYPTIFSLLHLWEFLTCATIEAVPDTEPVQGLLARPDLLKHCLTPAGWQEMGCCLVRIQPQGEILPARARYGAGQTWNIGVNPLTGGGAPLVCATGCHRGRVTDRSCSQDSASGSLSTARAIARSPPRSVSRYCAHRSAHARLL